MCNGRTCLHLPCAKCKKLWHGDRPCTRVSADLARYTGNPSAGSGYMELQPPYHPSKLVKSGCNNAWLPDMHYMAVTSPLWQSSNAIGIWQQGGAPVKLAISANIADIEGLRL